jgi:hypothetical protein
MKNIEFAQHEAQADAQASTEPPSNGLRRLEEDHLVLYDQCFSFDAIKERMQIVNKAYAASHGLLDK